MCEQEIPPRREAVLTTWLNTNPKDVAIRLGSRLPLSRPKENDQAIAEYNRVELERPADAVALNNLAWLYQQKAISGKARGLAERAITAARAPQIDDTLGWISAGDKAKPDKAVTHLSAPPFPAPSATPTSSIISRLPSTGLAGRLTLR
jgi:hypothetical protein